MNSQEIRERIAALEAEAEAKAQAESEIEAERWAAAAGRATGQAQDQDPADESPRVSWDSLFEGPLRSDAPSRMGDAADASFSLEAWLAEGLRGLRVYLASQGLDDEFWGHMAAAEREFLLAWRCLIEARLRRAEERQRKKPAKPVGRQDIEIEF